MRAQRARLCVFELALLIQTEFFFLPRDLPLLPLLVYYQPRQRQEEGAEQRRRGETWRDVAQLTAEEAARRVYSHCSSLPPAPPPPPPLPPPPAAPSDHKLSLLGDFFSTLFFLKGQKQHPPPPHTIHTTPTCTPPCVCVCAPNGHRGRGGGTD